VRSFHAESVARDRGGEFVERRRSGVHLRRSDVGEQRLGVLDPGVTGDVIAERVSHRVRVRPALQRALDVLAERGSRSPTSTRGR
jgi:hypothetical protein